MDTNQPQAPYHAQSGWDLINAVWFGRRRTPSRNDTIHTHQHFLGECGGGSNVDKQTEAAFQNDGDEPVFYSSKNKTSDEYTTLYGKCLTSRMEFAKSTKPKTNAIIETSLGCREVMVNILSWLPTPDLKSFALVCKEWLIPAMTALNDRKKAFPVGHPIHLNYGQRRVFTRVCQERLSMCILGEAGTGKSCVLKAIRDQFARTRVPIDPANPKITRPLICYVVAPTGQAASNIDGATIHEYFGISADGRKGNYLLKEEAITGLNPKTGNPLMIVPQHPVASRLRETDLLIIDEISMVSPAFFAYIERISRIYRRKEGTEKEGEDGIPLDGVPFGGMQVVCFGDFWQLPPIEKKDKVTKDKYCFTTPIWKRMFGDPFDVSNQYLDVLVQQMRQDRDQKFLDLLQSVRGGTPTQSDREVVESRMLETMKAKERSLKTQIRSLEAKNLGRGLLEEKKLEAKLLEESIAKHIRSILLCPHVKTVDEYNALRLSELKGKTLTYKPIVITCMDVAKYSEFKSTKVAAEAAIPTELGEADELSAEEKVKKYMTTRRISSDIVSFTVGARVAFKLNLRGSSLYNKMTGTIREVMNFEDPADCTELYYRLCNRPDSALAKRNKEAIFKVVGDASIAVCYRELTDGYPFVTVTTSRTPETFKDKSASLSTVMCISDMDKHLVSNLKGQDYGLYLVTKDNSKANSFPVVEFDSQPNTFYLVLPFWKDYFHQCTQKDASGHSEMKKKHIVSVLNLPLDLAYAQTFHAAQGQTLPCVSLSMARCWDPQQVYVGLSRVRSIQDFVIETMPEWDSLFDINKQSRALKDLEITLLAKKHLQYIDEKKRKREQQKQQQRNSASQVEAQKSLKRKREKEEQQKPQVTRFIRSIPAQSPLDKIMLAAYGLSDD